MPSNAELAATLLRDASKFFENVAEQNPQIADQMNENAAVFKQVADRVEKDPTAEAED